MTWEWLDTGLRTALTFILVAVVVANLLLTWAQWRRRRQWEALVQLQLHITVRTWMMRYVMHHYIPPGYVVTAKVVPRQLAFEDDDDC